MLLMYGISKVARDWYVTEKMAPGYVRMYYILGGDVVYKSASKREKLQKGLLYCFPSKTPYKLMQNPENTLHCQFLHIDISPYVLSELAVIDLSQHKILHKLLEIFAEIYLENGEELMDALPQQAAATIVEYLNKIQLLETVDKKIEKSVLYMLEHLEQPVRIEEISSLCGYHPQYYIKLFKEHMGVTPHQFLVIHRMKTARTMLQEGIPVAKVAETVGYKESKNFSRAFKQTYGISPSQARQILIC